ncbi:MAG TPA: 50S ribosome-binding GTPase [Phycisphaerales bacterium]|nr:50S ribosome-binding GTPase [Phycisphaerales bacterium]
MPGPPTPPTRYRLASPPPLRSGGAIGIITLLGDVSGTLASLRTRDVAPGRASLREIPGIDSVVIARLCPDHAMIFPHAGPAVMARLLKALVALGVTRDDAPAPRESFPEAASELEARMLVALARAQSPLAIDLLLDQPRRWSGIPLDDRDPARVLSDDDSRRLRRLIDPPLVVALGGPNIGKSSLVNALAGRSVAVVADMPGTTRDHVGVTLDLAGVVVRYVDTAGVTPAAVPADELDRLAQQAARRIASEADLLLLCADATSAFPPLDDPHQETLRIGLRADLGPPHQGADVLVSVSHASGLRDLTQSIGDRVVPPAIRGDPRAWVFW